VDSGDRPTVRQSFRTAFPKVLRLLQLSAVKVALLAVAFIPFVLLAVLVYSLLLSQYDIYFYLKDRPAVFWLAAGIRPLLLLAALAAALWLYVRWAFALPILVFEKLSIRSALRASRERIRGVSWRVAFILVGWLFGALLFGAALESVFQLIARGILANAGERPIVIIILLL